MRYYKYVESNTHFFIGTGPGGTEITEAEYNELLTMICEKAALVDALYAGEITIDSIREDWREEIQRRVDERIALEGALEEQPISTEEFYSMIEEIL